DYPESNIRLVVYFDETQNIDDRLKEIEEYIIQTDLVKKDEIDIDRKVIEESEWENEWKKYFHSFKVSETIVIVPSLAMEYYGYAESDRLIKQDTSRAFRY